MMPSSDCTLPGNIPCCRISCVPSNIVGDNGSLNSTIIGELWFLFLILVLQKLKGSKQAECGKWVSKSHISVSKAKSLNSVKLGLFKQPLDLQSNLRSSFRFMNKIGLWIAPSRASRLMS